jgi:pyruvate/2-oxoglutarate dehydrogenase complex dihydrolipoamide acyltransferase (E2) component
MPHDVTMPQLGMAQDAGKIVSWFKSSGDAVAKGDALFEVETDKATMEVEAQASGFLTGVKAAEGEDVPVGAVIARISESADDADAEVDDAPTETAKTEQTAPADNLPKGKSVTMPQLGMAQDSGLLVNWLKSPGDEVAADDVLFEVETDKSTMEVEAGKGGYLAATLANAGEEVPVGQAVAIISDEKPDNPVARSVNDAAPAPTPDSPSAPDAAPISQPEQAKPQTPTVPTGGKILASPKARRLALERGLDLERLAKAGHPQPYHVKDLDTLRDMPAETPTPAASNTGADVRLLTAETTADGFVGFAAWAAGTHGLTDADQLLAGLVGASLGESTIVSVERFGASKRYAATGARSLSTTSETEAEAEILVRDLRGSWLRSVTMGAEATPVLTIMDAAGGGLTVTLECAPNQLDAQTAITLLSEFAGRMEHPLRHLL